MHAWLCENPVGVEALQWKELPTPQPKTGEVLVEIKAASLNFPDLLIVQNKYQIKPPLPFVPGAEYAGVVAAVGPDVKHLQVGQNVACLSGTGGFGTHTIAPAALCLPLPPGFPHADAAAFIMTYATSHHALVDRGQVKPGETVLVLGAAGGVGTAAIQIAKTLGARVIAAASSDEKCELCRSIGADATINYSREKLREAIAAATGGRGPDVVYDPVGGDLAEPALRSLAWRGRYLVIGFASGRDAAIVISFSPYAPTTVEETRALSEQGVPIVAITDSAFSPLAQFARIWFEVAEADFAGFRSLSATMALAMALSVGVAEKRRSGKQP